MTKEEGLDHLSCILNQLEAKGIPKQEMYLSWDNAHANPTAADLLHIGVDPTKRLPLSAYSPDIHKVIEHFFHRLKVAFREARLHYPQITTAREAAQLLRMLASNMPQEHIEKDAETLKLTYQIIATDKGVKFTGADGKEHVGTGGDWAPRRYR